MRPAPTATIPVTKPLVDHGRRAAPGRPHRPRGPRGSAQAASPRPSLERREYERRRARLSSALDEECIVILPAAPIAMRNRDIEYAYRPDSDFLYLTGFPEPHAVAAIAPGRPQGEYILFCRERDAETERWLGAHAGLEEACSTFGADDAFPISDVDDILPGLLETRSRVYYAMGANQEFDHRMLGWLTRMRHAGGAASSSEIVALGHLLHDMRLYKSSAELRLIRRAVELSEIAHRRAMTHCRPGLREYQLEAELLYAMNRAGCRSPAYPSIVASGSNACVLHYTANSGVLGPDDLVLVDAGAEFEYYASDITRTYPVSGRFLTHQRELYEALLAAQVAAIEAVRPGASWDAPHRAATEVLTEGLVALGLLAGDLDGLLETEAYARFFMHPTGHWLGIDVHDVGDYRVGGAPRMLEAGMTITVEPGVYVSADDETVAPHWRGLGIRIEDDVLVTREGREVLSAAIPKEPAALEALVGSNVD